MILPRFKVLHDDVLKPYFKEIDMHHLKNQQNKLMALVFGGNDLIAVGRGQGRSDPSRERG